MARTKRIAFGASLALSNSTEPPTEFLIWGYGATTFRWVDGDEHTVVLTPELARDLLTAYADRGRQLAIDYNHGSVHSRDDREARAAGWFDVELRADGLWATNVTWTDTAAAYIRAREYRYTSPTWAEVDDVPVALQNLALTINPATLGALPLVASNHLTSAAPAVETPPNVGAGEEPTVSDVPTVRIATALGLPETAAGTDVALRAASLRAFEATVLERLGAPDREAAVAQLEAQADDLAAATTRVSELEAQAAAAERNEVISAAVRDGRLTPAQAADGGWARSQPVAALREFLASAPRVVPVGEVRAGEELPAEKTFADMSGPERARLYNADKARYVELRKANLGY